MSEKTSLLNKAKALPKAKVHDRGWWTKLSPAVRKQVDELFDAWRNNDLRDQIPNKARLQEFLESHGIVATRHQVDTFLKLREKLCGISDRQSEETTKRRTREGNHK